MGAMCPLSPALPAKGFKGKAGSVEQGEEVSVPLHQACTSWAGPKPWLGAPSWEGSSTGHSRQEF